MTEDNRQRDLEASDMVPVFQTADSALLPVIKSVLDSAGIPYVVQGDHAMGLLPLGPFGTGVSKGLLGVIVHVPRARAEEAEELLRRTALGSSVEEREV